MDLKVELLKSLKKNINVPGMAEDLIDQILGQALKNLVASTPNVVDDILVASIYPLLSSEVKKLIKEKWDSIQ